MNVKLLLSALLATGVMACAVVWAGSPSAKNGGAKDAICLAALIQEEPEDSETQESPPLPSPPPPPPLLKRLADPGYAAIEAGEETPFVEEQSPPPPPPPTSEEKRASSRAAKVAPKASTSPKADPSPKVKTLPKAADPPIAPPPPVPGQEPEKLVTEAPPQYPCQCQCPCQCAEGGLPRWRLFDWPRLNASRIEINGWLDQGITLNGYNPLNRFNGPVTFNDRSNEYQMNQLYVYLERKADTSQCDLDWGARVDLLYGTDARFTTARGLEDGVNSGGRFYGLALPQFYFDLAKDDLTLRLGHFYTILGYETVPAPKNFFYSHSYTSQYGLPYTHTGALAIYDISDNWSVTAGIHRGWDRFDDGQGEMFNGNTALLVGFNWISDDERTTGNIAVTSGQEASTGNSRTAYDLYVTRRIDERWTYVFEHTLGHESNGAWDGRAANWYSIVNYFFYRLNEHWQFGVRHEWFCDEEGMRVLGIGDPTSPAPIGYVYPQLPAAPHRSDWNELSLGFNYRPNGNFTFRSEVRFDWQTPRDAAAQPAFNDYHDLSQTLWANDVIFTF